MNTTPVRVLTAVLAISLLGVVYFVANTNGVIYLSLLIALIMQIEFAKILILPSLGTKFAASFVCASFLTLIVALFASAYLVGVFALATLLLFSIFLFGVKEGDDLKVLVANQSKMALGMIYCCILPFTIIRLLMFERGLLWFLTLFAIVFSGDIGAYFVGRRVGGPKIAPVLSPHKTWSGAIGGLISSAVTGGLLGYHYFTGIPLAFFILFAIAMGAFGQIGDFFESTIKRIAGVKDSGNFLPGHGGFLDRLDGILFAAPMIYLLALRYQI